MLFDRGPITPIDVDAWTRPGPRTTFAADVAPVGASLRARDAQLGGTQSALASASSALLNGGASDDLGAAAAAHDSQARDFDASIGTVAGNADSQTGEIAGLAIDTAADIQAGEMIPPDYVSHGPDPSWKLGDGEPPPPSDGGDGGPVEARQFIIAEYRKFLRRDPLAEGIRAWIPQWPDRDAIERGILASDEYAGAVNKLYNDYFDRDVHDDELADARNNHWGLDDVETNLRARS